MLHGFSGNRLTFSIDTIDTNAVEYFYEHGYDVWLFDYRLSSLVEGAKHQHTIDEVALIDLPNAVDKIIEISEAKQIDVLAHCVGSISMFMALTFSVRLSLGRVFVIPAALFMPVRAALLPILK